LAAVLGRPGDGGEPGLGELALPPAARGDVVAVWGLRLVLVEPGADLRAVLGQLGRVVQVHGADATTSAMLLRATQTAAAAVVLAPLARGSDRPAARGAGEDT